MHTSDRSPLPARPVAAALLRRAAIVVALCALAATVTATWLTSAPAIAAPGKPTAAPAPAPGKKVAAKSAADDAAPDGKKPRAPKKSKSKATLSGKLNLNTATVEQLTMLPGVGPSKAERVIAWRGKNGGFKRVQDLRKVKGFGYKTLKKLEPYLDVKGETTLAAK